MKKEDLKTLFSNLEDGKRAIIEDMLDDFIFEIEQIISIQEEIKKIGVAKNEMQAKRRRFLIKEYSDFSQRHDNKIKIMLSALNKEDGMEESPLLKMLQQINGDDQ